MADYFRLQDLTSASADTTQDLDDAVEIGAYKTLTVQVRKPAAASAESYLFLQTAAVMEEAAFEDVTPVFDLATAGNERHSFVSLNRYVRWRADIAGGTSKFLIDVIARED